MTFILLVEDLSIIINWMTTFNEIKGSDMCSRNGTLGHYMEIRISIAKYGHSKPVPYKTGPHNAISDYVIRFVYIGFSITPLTPSFGNCCVFYILPCPETPLGNCDLIMQTSPTTLLCIMHRRLKTFSSK